MEKAEQTGKPAEGWVALKHKTSPDRQWCISPKSYFEQHGSIPDCHANLSLSGVDEVMDHTLAVTAEGDDRQHLESLGFEILDNPVWYFDRKK
jgi:hypothetical protein